MQLQRDLDVNYRTAWYLAHRLREAMIVPDDEQTHFDGTVECDETFIGGKYDQRRKRAPYDKQAVFGALRRKTETECSKVRAFPIQNAIKNTLVEAVNKTVIGCCRHGCYRRMERLRFTWRGDVARNELELLNHVNLLYQEGLQ